MKRINFLLILLIGLNLHLFSEESQEMNPFQKYVATPSYTMFHQAVEFYNSGLENDTKNDNYRIMLSYLYLMEMERVIEQINIESDYLSPGIQFSYANLLLELNRFDEAIATYEILNDKYPEWSCPWRHKGEAFFKSDNLIEAEVALKEAIDTRIEHYDAYVMLAEVQEAMGNNDTALETLETGFTYLGKDIEAPDEEVDDVDVQFLYLRLLQKNGKYEQAVEIKKSLEKAAPDDDRWEEMK